MSESDFLNDLRLDYGKVAAIGSQTENPQTSGCRRKTRNLLRSFSMNFSRRFFLPGPARRCGRWDQVRVPRDLQGVARFPPPGFCPLDNKFPSAIRTINTSDYRPKNVCIRPANLSRSSDSGPTFR